MPKLLDNNGLTHLWTKFKEYLASWKTTNFGTGTYSNSGNISIENGNSNLTVKSNAALTVDSTYLYFETPLYADCRLKGEYWMATLTGASLVNIIINTLRGTYIGVSEFAYISIFNDLDYDVNVYVLIFRNNSTSSKFQKVSAHSNEQINVTADSGVLLVWNRV